MLSIDPAGRGKDELSYAVVKSLNGFLFVRRCSGVTGGYSETNLLKLANIAKEEQVTNIVIESNFGDGMFTELFKPVLRGVYPVTIEEVSNRTQKERRIIDTLEPVMNRHRLVVDLGVIQGDYESVQRYEADVRISKTLVHQMTRITYDRGALRFDDRLDALAMGVGFWTDRMARDSEAEIEDRRREAFLREIEGFVEEATGGDRGGTEGAMRWKDVREGGW